MKSLSTFAIPGSAIVAAGAFLVAAVPAAEPESAGTSAKELASQLAAAGQGNALVRAKLEVRAADGSKQVLQLQIKERRTPTSTDLLYQVQWPKERKSEAVILHQDSGSAPRGTVIAPPAAPHSLAASQMDDGLFGSDLSYQDAIENFFAWPEQAIVGSEVVNGAQCQILESKPGKSGVSSCAKVRSWVDTKRLIPLRIEKYSSAGHVVRRIETTYVARDQHDRFIPGKLIVRNPSKTSITEFDGARIEQGMQFTDSDFTPEAISK